VKHQGPIEKEARAFAPCKETRSLVSNAVDVIFA